MCVATDLATDYACQSPSLLCSGKIPCQTKMATLVLRRELAWRARPAARFEDGPRRATGVV